MSAGDTDRAGAETAARSAAAPPAPSLSVEEQLKQEQQDQPRAGKAKKVVYCVEQNVMLLASVFGVERLAFLTLTFADDVQDHQEASKRFNSFNTGVLSKRGFGPWVRIAERQASGKVHFHLVIVAPVDIRTGYKPETGHGSGAGWIWLCRERKFLLDALPKYSFGRAELVPLKKETVAAARYLAKYIVKALSHREANDRHFHLVAYSRKFLWLRPDQFSFAFGGAQKWRAKVGLWAFKRGYYDLDQLSKWLGHRWAFYGRENILAQNLNSQPYGPFIPFHEEIGFAHRIKYIQPRGNPPFWD